MMEPQEPTRDERPDEELLEALRSGEPGVYGELYSRYRNFAIMIARKYRDGSDDAQDLVSEAFAKILDALGEGKGPKTNFRAYLAQTVKNVALSGPRRTVAVGLAEELPVQTTDSAEDDVVRQESGATALRAYYALPERWRSVLWMLDVEGLRPREVAGELGMTPNAVSALSLRAREALKQNYLHEYSVLEPLADCSAFDPQIPALVRGRLSARKRDKVQKHLDSCPRCSSKALSLMTVEKTMHIWIAPVALGLLPLGSSMTKSAAFTGAGGTQADTLGVQGGAGSALVAGKGLVVAAPSMTAGAVLSTVGLVAAGVILTLGPEAHTSAELPHSVGHSVLDPFLPGATVAEAVEPTAAQRREASRLGSATVQTSRSGTARTATTASTRTDRTAESAARPSALVLRSDLDAAAAHRTEASTSTAAAGTVTATGSARTSTASRPSAVATGSTPSAQTAARATGVQSSAAQNAGARTAPSQVAPAQRAASGTGTQPAVAQAAATQAAAARTTQAQATTTPAPAAQTVQTSPARAAAVQTSGGHAAAQPRATQTEAASQPTATQNATGTQAQAARKTAVIIPTQTPVQETDNGDRDANWDDDYTDYDDGGYYDVDDDADYADDDAPQYGDVDYDHSGDYGNGGYYDAGEDRDADWATDADYDTTDDEGDGEEYEYWASGSNTQIVAYASGTTTTVTTAESHERWSDQRGDSASYDEYDAGILVDQTDGQQADQFGQDA